MRRRCRRFHTPALAALLCLFAYLSGVCGVLPGLLAVVAWVDGSHGVDLRCASGDFTLVLRHDRDPAPPEFTSQRSPRHHHGCLAGMLCTLAESRDAQADHLIHLVGESNSGEATGARKSTLSRWAANHPTTTIEIVNGSHVTSHAAGPGVGVINFSSRYLRSTVLLI